MFRLVGAVLWWWHTYTFNWAHKPLCERFERSVLRVGRVSLCRGCVMVYSGMAITSACLVCGGGWHPLLLPVFYGVFVPVMSLSYPPIYRRLPRVMNDLIRFATGGVFAFMVAFLFVGRPWLGVLNVVVFALVYRFCLAEYGKQKLRACEGCPELGQGEICSGYRAQADRIRAYELAMEKRLLRGMGA